MPVVEGRHVIVIAGPNGAGKTTVAPVLLRDALGVTEFVNADTIARGLSAFDPERVALAAGRIMVVRLRELAEQGATFAFETTLASRSFAPWIEQLVAHGYTFHLFFLWLPSADFAMSRVTHRVSKGGHSVPAETIRRRYEAGLRNFFHLYRPISAFWRVYDNSRGGAPRLIATGTGARTSQVLDAGLWAKIEREYADASA